MHDKPYEAPEDPAGDSSDKQQPDRLVTWTEGEASPDDEMFQRTHFVFMPLPEESTSDASEAPPS